jgi:hypothetical protein
MDDNSGFEWTNTLKMPLTTIHFPSVALTNKKAVREMDSPFLLQVLQT